MEPVLRDGGWENANDGILGADNKAAVVVLLALARHVSQAGAPVDVELLFTVGEEVSLAGSRAFDASRLSSDFGFVFDHASPIGEVVLDSPTHFASRRAFRGLAAHAGIRPEQGRSAILAAARAIASMRLGRVDERHDRQRGHDRRRQRHQRRPRTLLAGDGGARGRRGASGGDRRGDRRPPARGGEPPRLRLRLDVDVQRMFSGYRLSRRRAPRARGGGGAARVRARAQSHLQRRRLRRQHAIAQGLTTVNLANGTERNHEPGERVGVGALEQMLDVALALLDEAAALVPGAAL